MTAALRIPADSPQTLFDMDIEFFVITLNLMNIGFASIAQSLTMRRFMFLNFLIQSRWHTFLMLVKYKDMRRNISIYHSLND